MSTETRYIEIPNEQQFFLRLGYVVQREAMKCGFTADEVSVKARTGARYITRIFYGLAPFMQVFQLLQISRSLDIRFSALIKMAEDVSIAEIRAIHLAENRIVWAGGAQTQKQEPKPLPPTKKKHKPLTEARA